MGTDRLAGRVAVCALIASRAVTNAASKKPVAGDSQTFAAELRLAATTGARISDREDPWRVVWSSSMEDPSIFEIFDFRESSPAAMTYYTIFRATRCRGDYIGCRDRLVDDGTQSRMDPWANTFRALPPTLMRRRKPHKTGKPRSRCNRLKHNNHTDLLRHTSGLTDGFYREIAVRKKKLPYSKDDLYAPISDTPDCRARLAKLPPRRQPGTLCELRPFHRLLGRVTSGSGQSCFISK